jgi:hypothetical protein
MCRHARTCLISEEEHEYRRLAGILDRAITKAEGRNDTNGLSALIRERRTLSREFSENQKVAADNRVSIELVYASHERTNPLTEEESFAIRSIYGIEPSELKRPASAPEPSISSELLTRPALPAPGNKPPATRRREPPPRQPSGIGLVESEVKFWPGGFKSM